MTNSTWMFDLEQYIANTPLNKILLPGTHDSGTYSLGSDWAPGITGDATWAPTIAWTLDQVGLLLLATPYPYMIAVAKGGSAGITEFARRMSVAQDRPIITQLDDGIRYLDLRVAPDEDDTLRIVHGFFGTTVQDVLNQVQEFLLANTAEIVILDFNHFYGMTTTLHQALASTIETTLKRPYDDSTLLASYGTGAGLFDPTSTPSDFYNVSSGPRVVVLYGGDQPGGQYGDVFYAQSVGVGDVVSPVNGFLWPRDEQATVVDNFAETADMTEMFNCLKNDYATNRDCDLFYVTQGVIAPDLALVHAKGVPGGLIDIGMSISPGFVAFLNSWLTDDISLNILICDAYESCGIVELAQLYNMLRGGADVADRYLVWRSMIGGLSVAQAVDTSNYFTNVQVVSVGSQQLDTRSGIGAVVGDEQTLFVAWANIGHTSPGDYAISVASSIDGATFQPVTQVDPVPSTGAELAALTFPDAVKGTEEAQKCTGSPALAVFNERLWVAWADQATHEILLADTNSGGDAAEMIPFIGRIPLVPRPGRGVETAALFGGPALCVFNGFLYIAWQGADKDHSLNIAWSADGYHWTNNQMKVVSASHQIMCCKHEPAMAVLNGSLFLAFTATDEDQTLQVISMSSGADGLPQFGTVTDVCCDGSTSPEQSYSGVSMTTFAGTLYLAWITNGGPKEFYIQVANSTDGATWSNKVQQIQAASAHLPAIVGFVPLAQVSEGP